MIRQRLFNQPARVMGYLTMIESHWLFASSRDWLFDNDWVTLIPARVIDYLAVIVSHWLFVRVVIRAQSTNHVLLLGVIIQPARVIDYSTMIESHWLFIRVVIRVQSTNSHDGLFVRLITKQWFDNDCLINQLAWLIIRQWLSHTDYSPARVVDDLTMIEAHWLFASSRDRLFGNDWVTLIIRSSSHSSSINQPRTRLGENHWWLSIVTLIESQE